MKKVKRHFIKHTEFKKLLQQLPQNIKSIITEQIISKPQIEKVELEKTEVYLLEGKPLLIKRNNDKVFPSLFFLKGMEVLPKVIVDSGAVPHVCEGADVMRPGIVNIIGSFQANDLAVVVDEKHNKPIALGLTLYSNQYMTESKHGKMVKNIHFVGDPVWKLLRELENRPH